MNNIIFGINNLFNIFYFLIILRIFLSWIPSVRWSDQPWRSIHEVTELYLGLFRKIVPSFGGLDFSPIIAIIALGIIQKITISLLMTIMPH